MMLPKVQVDLCTLAAGEVVHREIIDMLTFPVFQQYFLEQGLQY